MPSSAPPTGPARWNEAANCGCCPPAASERPHRSWSRTEDHWNPGTTSPSRDVNAGRSHDLANTHGRPRCAPTIQGETVTSPATGPTGAPDLPEYAPIPAIAKGARLNEHGYHVWA